MQSGRACHFQLMIDSNLGSFSHRFRNTTIYTLKPSIKNCGQTAADGDLITIGSL